MESIDSSKSPALRQQVIDITGVFVFARWLALTYGDLGTIPRAVVAGFSGDRVFGAEKRDAFSEISNGQFDW